MTTRPARFERQALGPFPLTLRIGGFGAFQHGLTAALGVSLAG